MKSKLMNKEQLRMFAEMLNGEKQHCLFEDLVEERTGFKVLKPKQEHIEFLKTKGNEFKEAYNNSKNNSLTPNEKGHKIEDAFRKYCLESVTSGKGGGYPDAQIPYSTFNSIPYVEIKSFNTKHKLSSMRAFYYSATGKISRSTEHYLAGFELNDENNIIGVHIIANNNLQINNRIEGNASYRDMYNQNIING
jgi:hypothetical protein|tara:strand:- start:520 stop:1098 length:579 start_codon:yes stop_codon:yes gene_type:complete